MVMIDDQMGLGYTYSHDSAKASWIQLLVRTVSDAGFVYSCSLGANCPVSLAAYRLFKELVNNGSCR